MTQAQVSSVEELQIELSSKLQSALAQARLTRFEGVSEQALVWLALTPGWTVPLANACGFPDRPESPEKLFDRLHRSGQLERRHSPHGRGADAADYFVMTSSVRAEVLGMGTAEPTLERTGGLRFTLSVGPLDVALAWRSIVSDIGERMLGCSELPTGLRTWADLAARAASASTLISHLNGQIAAAFQSSDTTRLLDLIEGGRWLDALATRDLDTSVKLALQRAGRCLELVRRRGVDEDHLRLFLKRGGQIEAIAQFMSNRDRHAPWGMHFIGAGGVGKTMLMRYLTQQLSKHSEERESFRGLDVAVARIDFDYLNADYPSLAPGLMLWAFGQELRAYDPDGSATANFNRADMLFEEMHATLRESSARLEQPSAQPQFAQAVRVYIDALRCLRRQVLLIVDTCEELGRARDSGGTLPNVEETFRILRALHDGPSVLHGQTPSQDEGLASVRVLFSGRRPLASAGAGWRCVTASELPVREYLSLHQLRGFTRDEARRYLTDAHAPEHLVDSVIKGSMPEAVNAALIEWDDSGSRPADEPRCNPYNLRLYLDWSKEEPPPSRQDMELAGSDQYVELRILNRLHDDDLSQAMPVVAMLGHFDEPLLRAALGASESVEDLFNRLGQQEWITYRSRSGPEDIETVLDVQSGVRRLLLSYFRSRALPSLDVCKRAVDYLQALTLECKLDFLDWSHFDAALGASEHDLEGAIGWWLKVESRLFAERPAAWIAKLVEPLLNSDGIAGEPEAGELSRGDWMACEMRPFVLATEAAACMRMKQGSRALMDWSRVGISAFTRHGPMWQELGLRAQCGSIREMLALGAREVAEEVLDFWQRIASVQTCSPQTFAAVVATAEALLETEERTGTLSRMISLDVDGGPFRHIARLAKTIPPTAEGNVVALAAFAFSLSARAITLRSTRVPVAKRWCIAARQWFDKSIALADKSAAPLVGFDDESPWADWVPPEDIRARMRLEYARVAVPLLLTTQEVLHRIAWDSDVETLDGDRLKSVLTSHLFANFAELKIYSAPWLIAALDIRRMQLPSFSGLSARVTCNAHVLVPPMLVSIARMQEALGRLDDAFLILKEATDRTRRLDPLLWNESRRELMRFVRTYRLDEEAERLHGDYDTSSEAPAELWPMLALTAATIPQMMVAFKDLGHSLWRALYGRDAPSREGARQLAAEILHVRKPSKEPGSIQDIVLDRIEARSLAGTDGPYPFRGKPIEPLDPYRKYARGSLRRTLRTYALFATTSDRSPEIDGLAEKYGYRRAARIALDEGELLALRLPVQGIRLLECAANWFARSSDRIGRLLALAALAIHIRDGGEQKRLQVATEDLREAYEACVELLHLPTWKQLKKLAAAQSPSALDGLQPRMMRHWLLRIAACLAVAEALPQNAALTWSRARYQPIDYSGPANESLPNYIPAEWRVLFARSADKYPVRTRGIDWRRLMTAGRDVFGGTLSVGLLGVLFLKFDDVVPDLIPAFTGVHVAARGFIFLAAIVAVGLAMREALSSGKEFRALVNSLGTLDVNVRLADGFRYEFNGPVLQAADAVELQARWFAPSFLTFGGQLHARFPYLRFKQRARPAISAQVKTSADGQYSEMARLLPEEWQKAVADLSSRAQELDVILNVGSYMHHFAWEYVIASACADRSSLDLLARMPMIRRLPPMGGGARHRVSWHKDFDVKVLASGTEAQEVVRFAWRDKAFPKRVDELGGNLSIMHETDKVAVIKDSFVLHLVGNIEQTSAGPRLRLNAPEAQSFETAESVAPTYREWSAEELTRETPQACILQSCAPSGSERLGTDRYVAGLMRAFAAEISGMGVPYVVVIPPVPPDLAAAVAKEIASAMVQGPDNRLLLRMLTWPLVWAEALLGPRIWRPEHLISRRVSSAIVRIRRMIAEHGGYDDKDLERPFDVCFYCRDDSLATPATRKR